MSICLTTDESILTVWDLLSTVFAATFPVRIRVRLKLPPSFSRFVTLLTGYHTIIMLVLHVHLQMLFRESFITTHNTSKHGDCRFVLLVRMLALCVTGDHISSPKSKSPGKKGMFWIWYVLKVGPEILVESETIEREIEERCLVRIILAAWLHLSAGSQLICHPPNPPTAAPLDTETAVQ